MPALIDLTNRRFGRLRVVRLAGKRPARWMCRCDCGKTAVVGAAELRKGDTKSCGCLRAELQSGVPGRLPTDSAHRDLPEWNVWRVMLQRCHSPKAKDFPNYGGRGIKVCDAWRRSFVAFYRHVGDRPSPAHSIDRIDNDGDYGPGNVRWATPQEQARNCRTTRRIEYQGRSFALPDLADQFGISPALLRSRLDAGWSVDDALRRRVIPDAAPRTGDDA